MRALRTRRSKSKDSLLVFWNGGRRKGKVSFTQNFKRTWTSPSIVLFNTLTSITEVTEVHGVYRECHLPKGKGKKNLNSSQENLLMRTHPDKTLVEKRYFRSFFQAEVVCICRGLATNCFNYTWILISPVEHLIKRFFLELLILQNKPECTFPAQGKYGMCFKTPVPLLARWPHNGGVYMHKKGKAIVLQGRSKAPVVGSGTGEPSNRNSTTLLFPGSTQSYISLNIFKYEGGLDSSIGTHSYRDSTDRWISQGKRCPLVGDQNQLKNLRVAI